ncbi:unnamed protein product, partial [Meganyctiphanes norvegica]
MAKQKDPYDFRVYSNSSQAHFNSGEFKKAEDEALMAIKLNPFSEKAYHRAGKAAMKQSGTEAAAEYARTGMLICGEDRELQKLLEECAEGQGVTDTASLTAFYTDEGMEKLKKLAEEYKEKDKNNSNVAIDSNSTNIIETNSLAHTPLGSIKEVLSDHDSSSRCSWERLKTKADIVPPSDDNSNIAAVESKEDLAEESDSIATCSRSGGIATFQLKIENFSKLALSDTKLSEACYARNLPWKIMVLPKLNADNVKCLGFFLQCNGDTESTSWSCNANAELRLLSVVKDKKPFIRKVDHKFCSKEIDWGFTAYITWNEVLKPENGYIKGDAITVEVHLVADPPQGVSYQSKKPSSFEEVSKFIAEDDLDSEDEDKKSIEVQRKKEKRAKQLKAALEEEARKEEAKRKEEEKKKMELLRAEAKRLEELRAIPKDPYHQIIYEGRKFYEQSQYRQALEIFGKSVPESRNMNAIKVKLEAVVVQFLLGICKIQSGKGYILDGMDIMESLTDANSTFPSTPAAHYWLGIGFERIFLFKLAHHHGFLCSKSLLSPSKYKAIKWPGSEDAIPITIPEKLA